MIKIMTTASLFSCVFFFAILASVSLMSIYPATQLGLEHGSDLGEQVQHILNFTTVLGFVYAYNDSTTLNPKL